MGLWQRRLLLCAPVVLALTAGCAGQGPKTYVVSIAGMAFGPMPSQAKVGDNINWVNADIFEHTATDRAGAFDVDLPPGAQARTVLTRAGAYDIYCKYHSAMQAHLKVAAASPP